MSSPPLPSTPLAGRLVWLAAEVRAEKDEAGMIAAALAELFARLLTCLAGFAARLAAGTLPRSEPRVVTGCTPAVASVPPGLLPRVFGWLGGLLPTGEAIALPRSLFQARYSASPLSLREGPGEGFIRQEVYHHYLPSEGYLPQPLPQGGGLARRQQEGASRWCCLRFGGNNPPRPPDRFGTAISAISKHDLNVTIP